MRWFSDLFRFSAPSPLPAAKQKFAHNYAPREGRFEVFGGPMDKQIIDYTGERFRADAGGPFAMSFTDHEYKLETDEYSDRLYYVWQLRRKL